MKRLSLVLRRAPCRAQTPFPGWQRKLLPLGTCLLQSPVRASFVCGDTEDDARQREATLRDLGLIQSVDRVVRMPMQPDYAKPFLRHCLLEDWGPAKRDAVKAALNTPSTAYPAGWYTQPSQGALA